MYEEITIDDAINVVRVVAAERVHDDDRDVRAFACAARRVVDHIDEQSLDWNANARARTG